MKKLGVHTKRKRRIFIFTLPDWALERHITILAGSEPIAIKPAWRNAFAIKVQRCNMCGMCCVDPGENWIFGTKEIDLNGRKYRICQSAFKTKNKEGKEIVECKAPVSPFQCIIRCGALDKRGLPKECSLQYVKPWESCK